MLVGLPVALFLAGTAARLLGVDTLLTRPPNVAVFSADTAVLFVLVYYGEREFVPLLERMRPAFEMDDAGYYTFYGRLADDIYASLPFTQHGVGSRRYLASRSLLVASLVGGTLAAASVAWRSPGALGPTAAAAYLPYFATVAGLGGFAVYSALWYGGVVTVYMGFRVADHDVRLDITRAPENLGLRPYGRHVLKLSGIVFVGLAITGWSLATRWNPFSLLLVAAGAVVLPTFFVASQYGLHRAIKRSKAERLAALQETYTEDLDRWFSKGTTEQRPVRDLEEQVRINTMVTTKREIESVPEWPTNAADFGQVVVLALAYNAGVLVNLFA